MENSRLEVMIYQIVDDGMLKKNRSDGSGWEWGWADYQRGWMDATPNRFAYRCLPLTIANQTGWWIKNPVGFTATWRGSSMPGEVDFRFDVSGDLWKGWINNQFGEGIITWNTPFLFQTKPAGSRLLVCGPINDFKAFAQPLTALIESDWMTMSFTMNWKLMVPNQPVRFDQGEPLFQAIPLVGNVCADLEGASVSYQRLIDCPEIYKAYQAWHEGRRGFHAQKARGDVKPDGWQKDYFQGRDALGRTPITDHMTKVKPPRIRYSLPDGSSQAPAAYAPVGVVEQDSESAGVGRTSPSHRQALAPAIRDRPERGPSPQARNTTATIDATARVREPVRSPRPDETHTELAAAGPAENRVASVPVDDEWRRWIAENLMLDVDANSIVAAMTASDISREEALREVALALQSPYLRGAEQLRNRLRK